MSNEVTRRAFLGVAAAGAVATAFESPLGAVIRADQAANAAWTMNATINAAGKNTRLKRKKPMKLCPLRAATRAGQNAIAIQMIARMIDPNHHIADLNDLDVDTRQAVASPAMITRRCDRARAAEVIHPGESVAHDVSVSWVRRPPAAAPSRREDS